MTKRLARFGAAVGLVVAACLGTAALAAAAPPVVGFGGFQPRPVAVPAEVVAAHPGGQSGGATAVVVSGGGLSTNAIERTTCWRAYFSYDHSPGVGAETEWINPYWCGNGSVTRGLDSGWHGQTCTILVSCGGESGVGTWTGCANGCSSVGQQINGYFSVWLGIGVNTTLTVLYQLYPNGNYWSYYYSS